MPKNIVILCDGTSNEIGGDRTNILRLYGTLVKDESQLVFYDPGVGTLGAENSPLRFIRKTVEIWGLATGWGLDQNVKEAYEFLVNHYDDGTRHNEDDVEPDRLFLFGFSRGAYTVRVLAGFIHAVGIIRPENINLIDYAYQAYKHVTDVATDDSDCLVDERFKEVLMFERILTPIRPAIRCLGLFDTVGSVIELTKWGPRFRKHAFTQVNKSVESVRHALAIDERRSMFQPQLWPAGQAYWGNPFTDTIAKLQDLKEAWFTGVHSDIGGGYPEAESGLAKITLEWMIRETTEIGLKFNVDTVNKIVLGQGEDVSYTSPNPLAAKHNSLNWGWKLAELLPQRVKKNTPNSQRSILGWFWRFAKPRAIPARADIHDSVFKRRNTASDFEQPNIPK